MDEISRIITFIISKIDYRYIDIAIFSCIIYNIYQIDDVIVIGRKRIIS